LGETEAALSSEPAKFDEAPSEPVRAVRSLFEQAMCG
jgi:hypothetical protein